MNARYVVRCMVTGGVTGTRRSVLKENGATKFFATREQAAAVASNLDAEMNGNPNRTATFLYVADEANIDEQRGAFEPSKRSKLIVMFDTMPYERSHMKQPRGRGSWAFAFERNPQLDDIIWTPSMTYGEAKKWAREAVRGKTYAAASQQMVDRNERVIARFLPRVIGSHICLYAQP